MEGQSTHNLFPQYLHLQCTMYYFYDGINRKLTTSWPRSQAICSVIIELHVAVGAHRSLLIGGFFNKPALKLGHR